MSWNWNNSQVSALKYFRYLVPNRKLRLGWNEIEQILLGTPNEMKWSESEKGSRSGSESGDEGRQPTILRVSLYFFALFSLAKTRPDRTRFHPSRGAFRLEKGRNCVTSRARIGQEYHFALFWSIARGNAFLVFLFLLLLLSESP